MNVKKVLLSGVILWLLNTLLGWLTCGGIFNWVYKLPPNIWKSPEEMMSAGNMIAANLMGLLGSMIFAFVFALIKKGVPGEGIKKGALYGFLVWMVGALVGIASMPFFMTIATGVVIYWLIQSLVFNTINGVIVGALIKD